MKLSNSFVAVALVTLTSTHLSANVHGQSVVRSPQGFIFDCDNDVCVAGPYQSQCPVCDDFEYDDGASAIQCNCFDSNNVLQDVTTMRDSNQCSSIAADTTGALYCSGAVATGGKKIRGGGKAVVTAPTTNTPAPTPQFLQTASPTVGNGPALVDFTFNCVGGTCPSGAYQQFCPRCTINTDSTPPNDPFDSITCLCFNNNGQMLLRASTMWNYEACPKIVTSSGGQLACQGAPKGANIRIYGRVL